MYKTTILTEDQREEYTRFLKSSENSLLYASWNYKQLLETYLGTSSYYLLAWKENRIAGCLPLMIKHNEKYGSVANSLPFYGSNGGIIVSPGLGSEEANSVRTCLLREAEKLVEREKCVASTIISNPLDPEGNDWLKQNAAYDMTDSRIGQITCFPDQNENTADTLMKMFEDPRPRNIRKAQKSGIVIRTDESDAAVDFLYNTHYTNITAINGIAKEKRFFELIKEHFGKGKDYRIYIAEHEGKPVAALLIFLFNRTVEYFTPATVEEYRHLQPSALIIYQAMLDAIKDGYRYWNWGGTWLSQGGVYEFKKKWGTTDFSYYYYTRIYDERMLELDKSILLKEYPFIFVAPFSKLRVNNES
jgi:hypothetical protein